MGGISMDVKSWDKGMKRVDALIALAKKGNARVRVMARRA